MAMAPPEIVAEESGVACGAGNCATSKNTGTNNPPPPMPALAAAMTERETQSRVIQSSVTSGISGLCPHLRPG